MSSHQPTEIDCLIIGDGCIGFYIAQKIKQQQPHLQLAIKGRSQSLRDTAHKQWLRELSQRQGLLYIHDFAQIAAHVRHLIVTTKSDDVQAVAAELLQAGIDADYHCLIYNGILPEFQPAFPGGSARAITPAGYAFDRSAENGLKVVNADKPWPICGDPQARQAFCDFFNAAGQAADVDDSDGLVILRKYLINTAVNPLTVIYQRKVDELLDDPVTKKRIKSLLLETLSLLRASARFAPLMQTIEDDQRWLDDSFAFIETYRGHYTSAYHAFKAGQKVEIASLTGYALGLSQSLHQAAPENQRVWQDIKELESS